MSEPKLHLNEHQKKEFQIERIAFFSDAVFAIAITLLTIEIKVPQLGEGVSEADLGYEIMAMIPLFIGLFISFYVIGIYWITHHKLLFYLVDYNRNLLTRNLLFLLWIVLMPFSSAFYSEYTNSPFALRWYCVNIIILGIQSCLLWKFIANPKNKLSKGLENKKYLHYNYARALTGPAVFLLMFLLSFIDIKLAWLTPITVPLMLWIIKKSYKNVVPKWD